MRRLTLLPLMLLSGCATTWHNPHIDNPGLLGQQLKIDDGRCVAVASGAVPVPQLRLYDSAPRIYNFSGYADTYSYDYGHSTTTYSGTATSAGGGFASGLASGFNLGNAMIASGKQRRVYEGCMSRLGWTQDAHTDPWLGRTRSPDQVDDEAMTADTLQEILQAFPTLAYWQLNDPKKWREALAVNLFLWKTEPEYRAMPWRKRIWTLVFVVQEAARMEHQEQAEGTGRDLLRDTHGR